MNALLPQNEGLRLASLRELQALDTAPEERFDRITRSVAHALEMPTALISLVDADRQWFRSAYGLAATQTPRSVAFCAHAILNDEMLVVNDALRDERFATNPLVIGDPNIRFYAGIPVNSLDNLPIGTLCVIDYKPRKLAEHHRELLRAHAAWAESELNGTQARKALLDAKRVSAHLASVINNISDALIISDENGCIEACNPATEVLLGYPRARLIGRSGSMLMAGPYHNNAVEYARYLARGRAGEPSGVDHMRKADGTEVPVEIRIDRVAVDHQSRYIQVIRDTTQRYELEQMKSDFLAAAAHELRSPMSSIYGFAELLLQRTFSAKQQRELVEIIYQQSAQMTRLINELLDLARIESRAGRAFEMQRLAVEPIIRKTIAGFLIPPERSAVTLRIEPNLPAIDADSDKIQQALTNVLSNAYKYSPNGGAVELSVKADKSGKRLCIGVTDCGIGMPAAVANRIFERFFRGDDSTGIRGTGLGMTLVKEIIERHGGEVRVASESGKGTTITMTLPIAEAS